MIIGVPVIIFALFTWTQPTVAPLGEVVRYICVLGSLGAVISGGLLFKESIQIRKAVAQPVKESALEFLVMMEYEDDQEN